MNWNDPEERRQYMKEWRAKNKDKTAAYTARQADTRRLRVYGLTRKRYNAMVEERGGRCEICLEVPEGKAPWLCVDHDHATGKVRGLLCTTCNTAIGLLNDDPAILEAAIRYLKKNARLA